LYGQPATAVGQHGDRTDLRTVDGGIQGDLDLRAGGRKHRDHTVDRRPVRRAPIDHREHQDPAEGGRIGKVDVQVLPAGDGTGAVVAVQGDERPLVQFAVAVAQRLDDSFGAVGELVETAQIQVDTAAPEEFGEETGLDRLRVAPVQVDPHHT